MKIERWQIKSQSINCFYSDFFFIQNNNKKMKKYKKFTVNY